MHYHFILKPRTQVNMLGLLATRVFHLIPYFSAVVFEHSGSAFFSRSLCFL
jgi:hypothetical protein